MDGANQSIGQQVLFLCWPSEELLTGQRRDVSTGMSNCSVVQNFLNNFKVSIDIFGPMDDTSSDKSGGMNGTAIIDLARRNSLNEQHNMARLVRELRELTGLTQEKFAAKLGLTFPTINRWKNDRDKPSPLALEKIESLLRSLGTGARPCMKRILGGTPEHGPA